MILVRCRDRKRLTNDWNFGGVEWQRVGEVEEEHEGAGDGEPVEDQLLSGLGRQQERGPRHQHDHCQVKNIQAFKLKQI